MSAGNAYNHQEYTGQYLLAKCAEEFSAYLTDRNMSGNTRKNYLADLRSFFRWMADSNISPELKEAQTVKEFLQPITSDLLQNYRRSLLLSNTPNATTNRKLTTLRTFFLFASINSYIHDNPTIGLQNVSSTSSKLDDATLETLLNEYETDQKHTHTWIASDRTDILSFFRWYREQVTA